MLSSSLCPRRRHLQERSDVKLPTNTNGTSAPLRIRFSITVRTGASFLAQDGALLATSHRQLSNFYRIFLRHRPSG